MKKIIFISVIFFYVSCSSKNIEEYRKVVIEPKGKATKIILHYDDDNNLLLAEIQDKNTGFKFITNINPKGECSYILQTKNFKDIVNSDLLNNNRIIIDTYIGNKKITNWSKAPEGYFIGTP